MHIVDKAPERRTRSDRRHDQPPVAEELLAALARGEIELLFQPQFACSDGRLVGAEALARWRHPQRGQIGVGRLFALAERSDSVALISQHIVRNALAAAVEWRVPLRLSLNVTAADVAAGNFAQTIIGVVDEAGFPPEHLTLEITEQVLMADLERASVQLQQLADTGIALALDDFGAGFCNFDYLKRLPLHYLKLDRSMVQGIDENPRDLAVLRGIVAMAHALGLKVIAEGVERETQRIAISREGCDSWQGFLGAAPMGARELERLAQAPSASGD